MIWARWACRPSRLVPGPAVRPSCPGTSTGNCWDLRTGELLGRREWSGTRLGAFAGRIIECVGNRPVDLLTGENAGPRSR